MVLYEVNIDVNKSIYNKYISWLQEHLEDMLNIDGFLAAKVWTDNDSDNNNDTILVVVNYEVESTQKLQNYFDNQAKEMRKLAVDIFGDSIAINRRVLNAI